MESVYLSTNNPTPTDRKASVCKVPMGFQHKPLQILIATSPCVFVADSRGPLLCQKNF